MREEPPISLVAAGGQLSLGEAVAAAEARLFVGRAPQFAALDEALAEARGGPVVLYLHGPSGSGKSALLRQFRRRAEAAGACALLLDAASISPAPAGILAALAEGLGGVPPDGLPAAALVVGEANRRAVHAPVALLIDGYEHLRSCDAWLRSQVLYGLRQILVVLAGSRPPEELWGLDPAWRATVRSVPLPDLGRPEALEYLERAGLGDPGLRREVAAMAGGRPLLLRVLAGMALRAGQAPGLVPRGEARGFTARLLDEFTRGVDPPELREVLAAAAVVRAFDRDLLAAMVGPGPVAQAWEALAALPVVVPAGRRRALHDKVRAHLATAAARDRPWAVRRWRRRAIDGFLRAGPLGADREEVARLAAHALWHSWLHPRAEAEQGWRLERGAQPADLPALEACLTALLRSLDWSRPEMDAALAALPGYLAVWPEGFTLVRAAPEGMGGPDGGAMAAGLRGEILSWAATVPLAPGTRDALLADPALGPYLSAQGPGVVESWEGRTLALCQVGLADPEGEAHHVLVREVVADFAGFDQGLAVSPDARIQTFLVRLGFRPAPGPSVPMRGGLRTGQPFLLDLAGTGYGDWLRGRFAVGLESGLPPEQWPDAAAAALEALRQEGRAGADLAEVYRRLYRAPLDGEALAGWLMDGLQQLGGVSEGLRRVLSAYHVDAWGSHEVVAERLGLSQRTYYRRRRQALEELGRILFA